MAERGCLKDGYFKNLLVDNVVHGLNSRKTTTGLDTSSRSILASESGNTFFLKQGEISTTLTLPPPGTGLEYTFIVNKKPASGINYLIKVHNDLTTHLRGSVACSDDQSSHNGVHHETGKRLDFKNYGSFEAQVGDWVNIISDGEHWYYSGSCHIRNSIGVL